MLSSPAAPHIEGPAEVAADRVAGVYYVVLIDGEDHASREVSLVDDLGIFH
jgi:hypothetical protein